MAGGCEHRSELHVLAAPACPWWLLPWGSLGMKLTAFNSGDRAVAFWVCLFAEVQTPPSWVVVVVCLLC